MAMVKKQPLPLLDGRSATNFSDAELEGRVDTLKTKIRAWADQNKLWRDCSFKSWTEQYDDEPPQCPCVLILSYEGPLFHVLNGYDRPELYDEFVRLADDSEFHLEFEDHTTASFSVVDNDELADAYREYYEWRWLLDLITPEYSDLYAEIYDRFVRRPSDLRQLDWRRYEQLLDAIFRNNGYTTQLGPGSGDGGVDLRLYSNDVIGEAVTLVQAKRYSEEYPISLEAIQALSGAVDDERANRGLFVATSRYLPSAKDFAARQNRRITLATSDQVQEWCQYAATRIDRDKAARVSDEHVNAVLDGRVTGGLVGQIFHARTGYNMIDNEFAVVLKESKGAVLALKLPAITADGKRTLTGGHVPAIRAPRPIDNRSVFRAKKCVLAAGAVSLRGDRKLFSLWDGSPQHFDYCD